MTALGLALCGAAVLAVPDPDVRAGRLRSVAAGSLTVEGTGFVRGPRRSRSTMASAGAIVVARVGPVPVGAAAAAVGMLAAGPVVGVSAGIAGAVSARLVRGRATAHRMRAEVDVMVEAVTALTGELRAGGTPQAALWVAANSVAGTSAPDTDVHPGPGRSTGRTLGVVAATASLGGAVPAALRAASKECPPELGEALRHIAAGWQVSERSGASLGTVLSRVEDDLRARRRQERQVEAHLAGPRATGAMLALLPGFGLLLGTAMGAHPVPVLVHSGAGQFALLAGVALDALGALWTARLLRVGVR